MNAVPSSVRRWLSTRTHVFEMNAVRNCYGCCMICSSLLTYHTYGGEIREPLAATDADDLNTFKQLTTQGLLQSGYKKVRSGIGGAFLNWAYKQRGIVAYLNEIWNLQQAAGIKVGATKGTGNDGSAAAIGGMNTESELRATSYPEMHPH